MKTCSLSCSYRLHSLRSWSLRQIRCGSGGRLCRCWCGERRSIVSSFGRPTRVQQKERRPSYLIPGIPPYAPQLRRPPVPVGDILQHIGRKIAVNVRLERTSSDCWLVSNSCCRKDRWLAWPPLPPRARWRYGHCHARRGTSQSAAYSVIDRLVLWHAFTVVPTVPITKSDTSADLLPPEDQYLSLLLGRRITNATTFKLVPCRE